MPTCEPPGRPLARRANAFVQRGLYHALNQYGLIPNGIESTPRIHQLPWV